MSAQSGGSQTQEQEDVRCGPAGAFARSEFRRAKEAGHDGSNYDIAPDGNRFLMIKEGGGANQTALPATITVVLNWTEELKRLVP